MSNLKRSLGLPMLVFYGTGVILGAGIYSIIGKAAGPAGNGLWMSFLIAAIAAVLTALSYAELASMYPKAGAEFVYLTQAFHKRKWIGSSVGTAVAISGAATAATVAIAFAGYLRQFVDVGSAFSSVALLFVFTGLAIVGIRASAWANTIFTVVEVGGLALIIYLGLRSDNFGVGMSLTPHIGTLAGAALVVFSFFGFESIVTLSEEAKNPKRDIPRAIFISLGISTILYSLVGLAAVALVGAPKLAESDAPLMLAAQAVSRNFGFALGVAALFSTANTALISLIGSSRIIYGMARTGAVPKVLSNVLVKRKTPWVASLVACTCAVAFLPIKKIETVASVASFTTMIAYIGVNVALIHLRLSSPTRKRGFRVPFAIRRVPILPNIAILCSIVFMTQFNSLVYVIGTIFMVISAMAFYFAESRGEHRLRSY